jgi:endonuclease YncB( thermonuclease family)
MRQRPWGRESRDYLRSITPERITVISHGRDRYGRTIGEVITDDEKRENLNIAMIRTGQAAVFPKYCKDQVYYEAQVLASGEGSGIWEKDGLQQSPWKWRKAH